MLNQIIFRCVTIWRRSALQLPSLCCHNQRWMDLCFSEPIQQFYFIAYLVFPIHARHRSSAPSVFCWQNTRLFM